MRKVLFTHSAQWQQGLRAKVNNKTRKQYNSEEAGKSPARACVRTRITHTPCVIIYYLLFIYYINILLFIVYFRALSPAK